MANGKRILVVEDERSIAETIVFALGTEGFTARHAANAGEARAEFKGGAFDLVILDVGLPDATGFELCRELRLTSQVPIFFLTARSEEIDRVLGLELGADDYIAKPFSPRELTARVRSLFRRLSARDGKAGEGKSGGGKFHLDEERAAITFLGTRLELTRTEYKLLGLLLQRPGKVYSRQEILDRVSDNPDMSLDRTIDSHVKSLRAKLRVLDPGRDWILTHRGFGYSLADQADEREGKKK